MNLKTDFKSHSFITNKPFLGLQDENLYKTAAIQSIFLNLYCKTEIYVVANDSTAISFEDSKGLVKLHIFIELPWNYREECLLYYAHYSFLLGRR